MAGSGFHHLLMVASLRDPRAHRPAHRGVGFHHLLMVASLREPQPRPGPRREPQRFRHLLMVASLREVQVEHTRPGFRWFPPSSDGGFIAGYGPGAGSVLSPSFHHLLMVASLRASRNRAAQTAPAWFPPSSDGGFIAGGRVVRELPVADATQVSTIF